MSLCCAESESETENSVSEMKAAPGESWGDTDDEPSEIDNIRKVGEKQMA